MTAYYADEAVTLHLGEMLDVLPTLADASVDAVVCDPPYGLANHHPRVIAETLAAWLAGDRAYVPTDGQGGFMGRAWDRFVPPPAAWDECLRVLKPGGHLVAFAAPRTADLMGLSIRLAGFEIRDSIMWAFGGGMPKGIDVAKAIDKAAGAEREVVGVSPFASRKPRGTWTGEVYGDEPGHGSGPSITAPATDDAALWSGWNSQLKPSHEPIVLARKPLDGTVAANVLRHGTGALNVDATRTATADSTSRLRGTFPHSDDAWGNGRPDEVSVTNPAGRWPTNVLLAHPPLLDATGLPIGDACADGCQPGCPVAEMDRQSGHLKSGLYKPEHADNGKASGTYGAMKGRERTTATYGDEGGASRFFPVFRYEAKAPAAERPRLADGTAHVSVKPLELMRWLVRLVCQPGGLILDPFAGSGTTLEAAAVEGFRAVGVERHEPYAELCRVRLSKPIEAVLFGDIA